MKAKAIVFENAGQAALTEVELPKPTSRDLVVDVEINGVSVGTERWALLGKRREMRYPFITGYMGIGRIREAGRDAAQCGYAPGQRVYFGSARIPDAYRGHSWMSSHISPAVVEACDEQGRSKPLPLRLPEKADPLDAALAALGAVAMQGVEMAYVPAESTVLVAGLGVIGQYAAQIVRLKGARVAVSDPVKMRREIAMRNGADWELDPSRPDWEARVRQIAPNGLDIVIDTSSIADVVNRLFPVLRRGGKFILQGFYPGRMSLDLNTAALTMPTIYMPDGMKEDSISTILRWTADGRLKIRNMITHTPHPRECAEVYAMIAKSSSDFLGIVFDWSK